jgi:hypothetical protein
MVRLASRAKAGQRLAVGWFAPPLAQGQYASGATRCWPVRTSSRLRAVGRLDPAKPLALDPMGEHIQKYECVNNVTPPILRQESPEIPGFANKVIRLSQ